MTDPAPIQLQRPYLGEAELAAVREVFESGYLGMGPVAARFERRVAGLLGASHVVAVNTGTSALHLALEALELPEGSEVIVPSLTYVATIQAILAARLVPVFCEAREQDLNLDVDDATARITPRTGAILPVHYAGVPCAMDRLMALAAERGLRIVEDAAHAFGSSSKGQPVGRLGDVTCFSFDPIKNVTCGEGGAVVTEDQAVAERVRRLRVLGIDPATRQVGGPGWRCHLPDVNAAIGLAQLDRMSEHAARKREIAARYDAALAGLPGIALLEHDLSETFPFFYVIRVLDGRRQELVAHLSERGIGSGVHYPANHLQPVFERSDLRLPRTERLCEEILTIPLYVGLSDAELARVIEALRDFCG
ncbi:MAG: DegT/DnrJ/EryC1/StrS family aminotransferase [Myxococcota bacterium]